MAPYFYIRDSAGSFLNEKLVYDLMDWQIE